MLLSGIARQVPQLIVFMRHAPQFFCYEACYSVFIFLRPVPQFYCCEARSSVYIYISIFYETCSSVRCCEACYSVYFFYELCSSVIVVRHVPLIKFLFWGTHGTCCCGNQVLAMLVQPRSLSFCSLGLFMFTIRLFVWVVYVYYPEALFLGILYCLSGHVLVVKIFFLFFFSSAECHTDFTTVGTIC